MSKALSIKEFIDRYLITIQKPGRYVGGEFNQIIKSWDSVDLHIALAFPDIYDIGFSNLGLSILYQIINKRPDTLAERVFSPWIDMEELLREKDIPLFTLESKIPLQKFDLIGISIPYETLYTNVLNMLQLGRIPIHAADRKDHDPIILAGGHSTFNPEPMHEFIDAFVIGEGEEITNDIIDVLTQSKTSSRRQKIDAISNIEGIYVPDHFSVEYKDDNTIQSVINRQKPEKYFIRKRFILNIDSPIVNNLVPNIGVVHDRISIEIMRGCPRGCRFCHAGMIMRPVREASNKQIITTIRNAAFNTGFSEVSLLSLSTSDHSKIAELIADVNGMSKEFNMDFSLPSLRIESFDSNLINSIKGKRKGNFTLAPEAGTDTIRSKINKPIPYNSIINTVREICEKGWNNIKLYFMIGFPDETMEDIEGIFDLCRDIRDIGKRINKGKFKLHVSINNLIPKPHTPFQWVKFNNYDQAQKKITYLVEKLRKIRIKLDYFDYEASFLESILTRGDRRLSNVIYTAWKNGAKFDAWREGFSYEFWKNAFNSTLIEPEFYSTREREKDEIMPWDHIHTGVTRKFLLREFERSNEGLTSPGCDEKCLACGIQNNFKIECSQVRTPI